MKITDDYGNEIHALDKWDVELIAKNAVLHKLVEIAEALKLKSVEYKNSPDGAIFRLIADLIESVY